MRAELKADIEILKRDMTIRPGSMMVVAVGVILAGFKLIHSNMTTGVTAAADHHPPCPCCGGRMIIVESFGRGGAPRAPPSPQAGVRTAMP